MPAIAAMALVLSGALSQLGVAVVLRARADAAADAAALAAADQLALGNGSSRAAYVAQLTARANGATLLRCECAGRSAEVRVEVRTPSLLRAVISGDVGSSARAEVDLDRLGLPGNFD